MHILVLSERFLPEIFAPSYRIMEHAKEWIKNGHQVTVVTSVPNAPRGKVFQGYKNRLYQEENLDGVKIVRVWTYIAPNTGRIRRIMDYLSFMISSALQSYKFGSFDLILATSPTLFTAIAGWLISIKTGKPWIFEVRDLWPASIEAVGVLNGRAIKALEILELHLYRKSHRIIVLTSSFKSHIESMGISSEKIDVVHNGVVLENFNPSRIDPLARIRLGFKRDAFICSYIGTTGAAHELGIILECAELLKGEPLVQFLIIGDGAQRKKLEAISESRNLTNVCFKEPVSHSIVPEYYYVSDLFIVHLKSHPVFKTVIPSKMLEAMAMNVPIICAVEGESAEIVKQSEAGICVPPENPQAMAEAIKEFIKDPSKKTKYGHSSRSYIANNFNRRIKAQQALKSFKAASGAHWLNCTTHRHDSS